MKVSPDRRYNYAVEWHEWWDKINPIWRTRSNNRLVPSCAGDWSCIFVPGSNGFATVISALIALKEAAPAADWLAATQDVQWTLGEVLGVRKAQGYAVRPVSCRAS